MAVQIKGLNRILVPMDPQGGIGSMRLSHHLESSYLSSQMAHWSLMLIEKLSEAVSERWNSQPVFYVFGCATQPGHFATGAPQALGPPP